VLHFSIIHELNKLYKFSIVDNRSKIEQVEEKAGLRLSLRHTDNVGNAQMAGENSPLRAFEGD